MFKLAADLTGWGALLRVGPQGVASRPYQLDQGDAERTQSGAQDASIMGCGSSSSRAIVENASAALILQRGPEVCYHDKLLVCDLVGSQHADMARVCTLRWSANVGSITFSCCSDRGPVRCQDPYRVAVCFRARLDRSLWAVDGHARPKSGHIHPKTPQSDCFGRDASLGCARRSQFMQQLVEKTSAAFILRFGPAVCYHCGLVVRDLVVSQHADMARMCT